MDIELQIVFVDFKQAIDNVNTEMLQEDARRLNIPKKLARLLKVTLSRTTIAAKTQRTKSR